MADPSNSPFPFGEEPFKSPENIKRGDTVLFRFSDQGFEATVLSFSPSGNFVQVKWPTGDRGWIDRKRITEILMEAPTAPLPSLEPISDKDFLTGLGVDWR